MNYSPNFQLEFLQPLVDTFGLACICIFGPIALALFLLNHYAGLEIVRRYRDSKLIRNLPHFNESYAKLIWIENGSPSLDGKSVSDWYRKVFLPEQKRREANEEKHSKALDDFYK